MNRAQLQRQATLLRRSFFDEGYLDEQFIELEELQDDTNPNFVEEIVTVFYTDSARLITNIEQALMSSPMDFEQLDDYMHQFKGSCTGIGAKKVKNECTRFNDYCSARNSEGCIRTFQRVKQEYRTLRNKLQAYFEIAREAAQN